MQIVKKQVGANCDIALLSDSHEGNSMASLDNLDDVLAWIMQKKNRYYTFGGDAIEAQTVDDKRFDIRESDDPIPLHQVESCINRHWPSRTRCLTWLDGNHEWKLHRFGDVSEHIAQRLRVPYGTASCKLHLYNGTQLIGKFFLIHPHRGQLPKGAKDYEQRQANKKAGLKNRLCNNAGDCILMGAAHYHELHVVPPQRKLILTDDGEQMRHKYLHDTSVHYTDDYIDPDRRWYVCTGSFLKLYSELGVSGYAERANLDPIEVGYPIVHIRKGRVDNVSAVTL